MHGDVLYYHHRYLYINTIFINLHFLPQLIIIICTAWVVWKVELHCRSCWADPGQGRPRTCRNIVTASDWGIQRRHISRHTRSHITSSLLKRDQNLSRKGSATQVLDNQLPRLPHCYQAEQTKKNMWGTKS